MPILGAPKGSRTHDCPGKCGRKVSNSFYACQPDWWRLPQEIRDRIIAANRTRPRTMAHTRAMADAADWYRAHNT